MTAKEWVAELVRRRHDGMPRELCPECLEEALLRYARQEVAAATARLPSYQPVYGPEAHP